MARRNRLTGRNREGGYDLSAAHEAGSHGSSRPDTGRASSRHHSNSHGAHSVRSHRAHGSTGSAEPSKSAMAAAAEEAAAHLASIDAETHAAQARAAASHARTAQPATREPKGYDLLSSGDAHVGEHESLAVSRSHSRERSHESRYAEPADGAASYSPQRYKARKQGMGGGKKIALTAVVVVLVVLLGAGAAFGIWYSGVIGNLTGDHDINTMTDVQEGEPYYILLLGGDSRADKKEDNRTDSITVARVDEQNQKVSLISVPRDLRVKIEGHGYQKINSAIEFGGYDLVIKELNETLGININYYVFIYFSGFKDLVDELGGVTVKVPEGTYYNGVWVPAGDAVEIDGQEALVLARCRHGDPPDQGAYAMGDYQRTLNQRNLIKAIAKKVLSKNAAELPGLVTSLSKCIETNLGVDKIVELATKMKGMDVGKIHADSLPYAGSSIDEAYYAILYQDVFEEVMANYTSGAKPYKGLGMFDSEMNGNDIGSDYTDGEVYAYTTYEHLYGDYHSKK